MTDSEKLDKLMEKSEAWVEDSKLLKVMATTVTEWDHLFKGNKDMKIPGVFERMWDAINKQRNAIDALPCRSAQGCEIAPKSKAREKAKEWGPVGFCIAVGIGIYEYIRRSSG